MKIKNNLHACPKINYERHRYEISFDPEYMNCKKKILALLLASVLQYKAGNHLFIGGDSLKAKKVTINCSVLEVFPTLLLYTSNFNLGTEIYLKKGNSVYLNGGFITSHGKSSGYIGIYALETKGFKIQAEAKHYLGKHKVVQPAMLLFWPHIFQFHSQKLANTGFYVSTHCFFQSTETLREQSFAYDAYGPNKPRVLVDNRYVVSRRVGGLHLKFGYHCIKPSGVSIDYAVGAGAQIINSESGGKSSLGSVWSETQTEFGGKLFDSGFAIAPSFVYHLRIGFGY